MKKKVIEFLKSMGYWKTAYSGKERILYVHVHSSIDTIRIESTLFMQDHKGDLNFKVEVQYTLPLSAY